MSAGNILFLFISVGGLTLFGSVLAWASWMEGRENKAKAARADVRDERHDQRAGRIPSAQVREKVVARPF